jgi:GH24 family phage-related lysozyme (muramidase)
MVAHRKGMSVSVIHRKARVIVNLADQLIRDEGCKSYAYQDSRGLWTVGIGTCIDQRAGCGLTNDEILLLFKNRLALAKAALGTAFPWTAALDDARLGAMENLTFNMGVRKLAEFHNFIAAMKQGDWATAKAELLDSLANHQEPARIGRLAIQIETGVWQ